MTAYILPAIFIFVFCYARYKKVPTYDTFVKGAKKAIPLAFDIFPYIATIMIAVALLRASGITLWLAQLSSPLFNLLGIPKELIELVLLRPFTGSGSYALLNDIFLQYGADSYISRCACVILCNRCIYISNKHKKTFIRHTNRLNLRSGRLCCRLSSM